MVAALMSGIAVLFSAQRTGTSRGALLGYGAGLILLTIALHRTYYLLASIMLESGVAHAQQGLYAHRAIVAVVASQAVVVGAVMVAHATAEQAFSRICSGSAVCWLSWGYVCTIPFFIVGAWLGVVL
tara:strand:+ start:3218 stop:3598 length:381 start_codon:yes stop_codon:yes gene_type:complete